MNLEEIILRCSENDINAQSVLYKKYAKKLFGTCIKYTNNYDEANDLLQDGFITILSKISSLNSTKAIESWMTRIMINEAMKMFRLKGRFKKEELKDEYLTDDEELDLDENHSLEYLLSKINELPKQYKIVFNMYILDGFTHKEIAETLDISINTSKSNLSRAKKLMKQKLSVNYNTNLEPKIV